MSLREVQRQRNPCQKTTCRAPPPVWPARHQAPGRKSPVRPDDSRRETAPLPGCHVPPSAPLAAARCHRERGRRSALGREVGTRIAPPVQRGNRTVAGTASSTGTAPRDENCAYSHGIAGLPGDPGRTTPAWFALQPERVLQPLDHRRMCCKFLDAGRDCTRHARARHCVCRRRNEDGLCRER